MRREHFLGPGPWPMLRWPHRYVPTPSDDPVYLYQDALVGIIPERSLNNGQPRTDVVDRKLAADAVASY